MSPQFWIATIGSVVLLGFILNGVRMLRGPKGHAYNAALLQAGISVLVLPVMWTIVLVAAP